MFAIFYGDRSAPNDTPGYGGGHMASKISRENGLEHVEEMRQRVSREKI